MRPRLLVTAIALLLSAGLIPAPAHAGSRERGKALVLSLKRQVVESVEFKDAPLAKVVKWLRIATGKNIVIKQATLAKAGIELSELTFTASLKKVRVTTLLSLMLKPHKLSAVVKGNILFITTKKDSVGKPITRMYGIAHITYTKTDFIAPRLDLPNPSNFEEERPTEVVVEDDPLTDGDAVAELVKKFVDPKGWEDNDDWRISGTKTYLIVRAPRHVHAKMFTVLGQIASMK